MRHCPICDVELKPCEYEGFNISVCPSCLGHLVREDRLKSIKTSRRHSKEQLKREASQFSDRGRAAISCPRCERDMANRRLKGPIDIHIDVCDSCRLIWFDAGELAIAQLMYEASSRGLEQEAIMQRAAALENSPERKQQLEDNLKKMPKDINWTEEVVTDVADEVLKQLLMGARPYF